MGGRRLAEASRLLDEFVAAHPREPNVHYARGVLRATEAPDQALDDFLEELKISPSHIPARLQLVFELVKRGDAERARPYAEDALRLDPQHFAVHLAMGQVFFETGAIDKAIAAFERGAKLAPGSAQAHFLLARAYGRAGGPPTPSANGTSSVAWSSSRPAGPTTARNDSRYAFTGGSGTVRRRWVQIH
jgi:tetratricopeptide (TPR) repeat protein